VFGLHWLLSLLPVFDRPVCIEEPKDFWEILYINSSKKSAIVILKLFFALLNEVFAGISEQFSRRKCG
jgi:hypothetical protein